jgi:hypothetical protein
MSTEDLTTKKRNFTAADEQRFIDGLADRGRRSGRMLEALTSYRDALSRRTAWGNVDREAVFSYLNRLIAEAESVTA